MRINKGFKALVRAINDYTDREYDYTQTARELIDEYKREGYLPIAYTTYELAENEDSDAHEIQVGIDLKNHCWVNYIDNKLVLTEERDSLTDIAAELDGCDFDDIIRECVHTGWRIYGEE